MNDYGIGKIVAVCIAMVLLMQNVSASGLYAQINTESVAVGDSFQLTLTAEGIAVIAPDLSPLTKEFDVLGTSQSSQTQIINGKRTEKRSWVVSLSPKKKGDLVIPVIAAGPLSSNATTIKVLDASEMPKSIGATGISVTATMESYSPYIYQEIPLKVRIESAHNLQQGALAAPGGSDFELTQSGQDRHSQIVRNGQRLNVIERDYLLSPQIVGEISVPPFVLQGTIADSNSRTDPFSQFGFSGPMMRDFGFTGSMMRDFGFNSLFEQGKPFKVRSDAITLSVLGNPNSNQEDWFLPAKQVKLEAEWIPENPEFRVGEAVTRRVSLLALGARPEQLPELDPGQADGAKFYRDDSATEEVQTSEGTVARKDIFLSVVPTSTGEVVLPEIAVQWHDTMNNTQQIAVLPQETIRVIGGMAAAGLTSGKPTELDTTGNHQSGTVEPAATDMSANIRQIAMVIACLCLLLVGGGVLLKRLNRNTHYNKRDANSESKVDHHTAQTRVLKTLSEQSIADSALARLQKALKRRDATKAYDALLVWLRTQPQGGADMGMESEIQRLEHRIFGVASDLAGQQDTQWDPRKLNSILNEWLASSARQSQHNKVLPPLYPNQKPI